MIAPGGTALTPINDGLTIPTVSSLALRDGRIYAGTAGALFVATVAPSSVEEEMMAERGASGGFVPNPVRGAASLGFTIASPQHVTLDIYDAAGSHVATLLAGRVEAGEHWVSWSTEGVPAGGYLWRLRGSRWSRGGMVVVR